MSVIGSEGPPLSLSPFLSQSHSFTHNLGPPLCSLPYAQSLSIHIAPPLVFVLLAALSLIPQARVMPSGAVVVIGRKATA